MTGSERHFAQARARLPKVRVTHEQFEEFLARHRPSDAELEAHARDLLLACACALGDQAALAEFEKSHMSAIGDFVARTDASSSFADEVRQALRERLFVGSRPRIGEYSGAGPLGAWLRVAAVRLALNLKRKHRKADERLDTGAARVLPSARPDPELDYLQARYGRQFREAFQRTLSRLSPRDKNLLTLHYLESVPTAAIARTFKVHAATVRRWLEEIRASIVTETHAVLREQLELTPSELDSLLRLVDSEVAPSVGRYLR